MIQNSVPYWQAHTHTHNKSTLPAPHRYTTHSGGAYTDVPDVPNSPSPRTRPTIRRNTQIAATAPHAHKTKAPPKRHTAGAANATTKRPRTDARPAHCRHRAAGDAKTKVDPPGILATATATATATVGTAHQCSVRLRLSGRFNNCHYIATLRCLRGNQGGVIAGIRTLHNMHSGSR